MGLHSPGFSSRSRPFGKKKFILFLNGDCFILASAIAPGEMGLILARHG